jgi:type VI secretion system VasD/TssJ family lipoprotein
MIHTPLIKHTLVLSLVALLGLSLTGCNRRSVSVDDADVFVGVAIKEALAEVAEIKLRPSQVAFSFYADKDVNAMIKQRVRKPRAVAARPRYNPDNTLTQLTTYRIQCDKIKKVTYVNCRTFNLPSLNPSGNVPLIHFKQIQLRKNKQLKVLVESADRTTYTNNTIEYRLQCTDKSPNFYSACTHILGTAPFTVKSLKIMEVKPGQFQMEILVGQMLRDGSRPIQQATFKAIPTVPPIAASKWVDSYVDPKPISFKVLMLRDNSLLLSADKESLDTDLENTLGKNYIDHNDYVLTPGQFKFVNFSRLDADVRYIGIIADYRDDAGSVWKKTFKVAPTGNTYPLHIHLTRQAVEILTEQE